MRGMPEIADKKLCFELFCHSFASFRTASEVASATEESPPFCHSDPERSEGEESQQ